MRKKIVGIFVCMLMIGTALPSVGMMKEVQSINENKSYNYLDYEFISGEFIVKFKEPPISYVSIDKLNEKYKVRSMEKIFRNTENTLLDNIYLCKVSKDSDIISIVNDYSLNPNVEYAVPNIYRQVLEPTVEYQYVSSLQKQNINTLNLVPNDPFFFRQWHLNNTGENLLGEEWGFPTTPDCDIDADEAWEIEKGSSDIVIAIIDSGVDYTHPDLIDNIWINEDEIPDNDIDDDNNGYVDDYYGIDLPMKDDDINPLDDMGHGTICAGIASAVTNNDIGISGVCWNCKIMCIKVMDKYGGTNNDWPAEGIQYAADNGADIISMSFGIANPLTLWKDALDYAHDKGIVLVAAAGNDGKSKEIYPAGFDNVIAVAGTEENDSRMNFPQWNMISRYGYWIDIAAPSVDIYSTMPTYEAYMNTKYDYPLNYSNNMGTSFACPQVAGIAALLLSKNPSYSPEKVRAIIRANTDPYFSDAYIGTGRVNAYKSLMELNNQPENPDKPTGKTNGKPGREYKFTTSTIDEDGDELWYFWDWGDGNYSGWLGPYGSGDTCEASHTWQQEENFSIKVKAKDGKGGESYWSDPLPFSTPYSYSTPTLPFFKLLFQRFPNAFPLLRHLMGN